MIFNHAIITIMENHKKSGLSPGFDAIGSIAIVKPPKTLKLSEERRIAENIINKNKNIKTVLKKIGKTDGTERVFGVRWLAGEKNLMTLHKENGIRLFVEIGEVFFTPRLANERLRIFNLIKKHELVLDMFCGVGPYSVLAAKKARSVVCVDINPIAIALIKQNAGLNKLNNMRFICGDALKVVPKLTERFDRIIMNFPLGSYAFLKAAVSVTKKSAIIHQYTFVNTKEDEKLAIASAINKTKKLIARYAAVKNIKVHKAGEIAPYILRLCLDIKISKRA